MYCSVVSESRFASGGRLANERGRKARTDSISAGAGAQQLMAEPPVLWLVNLRSIVAPREHIFVAGEVHWEAGELLRFFFSSGKIQSEVESEVERRGIE